MMFKYCFFLMIRRPPGSTRTDTLVPYTTLFRSSDAAGVRMPAALVWQTMAWASGWRSEEHTSELQSLMRISYAVCCLQKKNGTQLPAILLHDVTTHAPISERDIYVPP